jgi:hypothetical protein
MPIFAVATVLAALATVIGFAGAYEALREPI